MKTVGSTFLVSLWALE